MAEVCSAKTVYCDALKEWVTLVGYRDGTAKSPYLRKARERGKGVSENIEAAIQALIKDYEADLSSEKAKA